MRQISRKIGCVIMALIIMFTSCGIDLVVEKKALAAEKMSPDDVFPFDGKIGGKSISGIVNNNDEQTFLVEKKENVTLLGVKEEASTSDGAYRLFEEAFSWSEAKEYCETLGGHLATITSQEEQSIIEQLLEKGSRNSYWIGGYEDSENNWKWVTGEEFEYSNFAYGEPNNCNFTSIEGEDSLMVYKNKNPLASAWTGAWNDLYHDGTCGTENFFGLSNFGFICEWDSPNNDESEPLYLKKAEYKYGFTTKNLLTQAHSIETDHEPFSIICEANEKNKALAYALFSGSKLISKNKNGEFKDIDASKFEKGEKVSVKVYGKNKCVSSSLLLDVKKNSLLKMGSIGIGGSGVSFNLSDDIPILGGSNIKYNLPKLPVSAVIEDGKIKIGINIKEKELYSSNSNEGLTTTTKKEPLSKKIESWKKDMYKSQMISKDIKGYLQQADLKADIPAMKESVDFTAFGYGEATWSDSLESINFELVIAVQASVMGQTQFTVLGIPMTANIDITAKGQVSGKANFDFVKNSVSGEVDLGASLTLEPYVGVGVGTWFSAGIYGNIEGGFDVRLFSASTKDGLKGPGLKEVYISGEAGVKAYFAKKEVAKLSLISTELLKKTGLRDYMDGKKLLLYSDTKKSIFNRDGASLKSLNNDYSINEDTDMEEFFRWQKNDKRSAFFETKSIENERIATIQNKVYEASKPKLTDIDGKTMLVFVDNEDERELADQTAVKYCFYDDESESFSSPQMVVDDGTADFDPHVFKDGKDLYVYYQDSSKIFGEGDDVSIEEYAGAFSITVAKFDSVKGCFTKLMKVNRYGNYCYSPFLTKTNDGLMLTWVENGKNHVIGLNDKNEICSVVYKNGEKGEVQSIAKDINCITSIAASKNGEVAYVVDGDNDLITNDGVLYISSNGVDTPKKYEDAGINCISYDLLPGVNGKEVLLGVSNGVLSYFDEKQGEVVPLKGASVGGTHEYQIDGDRIYYLKTEQNKEGTNRNIAFLQYVDGQYYPVTLTEENGYVDSFNITGNKLVYQLNDAIVNGEEIDVNSMLRFVDDVTEHKIVLDDVEFEEELSTDGNKANGHMMITNNGTQSVSTVKIEIVDGSNELIFDDSIDVNLMPGASQDIHVSFIMPKGESRDDCKVKLYEESYSESSVSQSVELNKSDLSISGEYEPTLNTDGSVIVTVKNESSNATTAKTVVSTEDGTPVFEKKEEIEGWGTRDYRIIVDGITDENVYNLSVTSDKPEYYEYNNTSEVSVWKIKKSQYIKENLTEDDEEVLKSLGLKIEDGEIVSTSDIIVSDDDYVKGITTENNSASDVSSVFDGEKVSITDTKGNEVADDGAVGTGYTIKVGEGSSAKEYKAIVRGDVNGDAKVNGKDTTGIAKALLSLITFTEEQKQAGDFNMDGKFNGKDTSALAKHLLGL